MDQAEYKKLKFLFEPIDSPDKLDEYFRFWLKVQFPWDTVDNDSTGAPLKVLWEIYKVMLTGKGQQNHIVAASRNTAKTLSSAAIHFFSMVHFRRDDSHVAATLNQSGAASQYLNQFIYGVPELVPFINTQNSRSFSLVNLPATDFTSRSTAKIQIVTATKKGSNAPRASCFSGKTEVLVYGKNPQKNNGSRFRLYTMDGIYKRFNKGEEILAASVDGKTCQIEADKIIGVKRSLVADRMIIKTELGHSIECTEDHWLSSGYNESGIVYSQAKDFKAGDIIISKNNCSYSKTKCDDFNANKSRFKDRQKSLLFDKVVSIERKTASATKRERWVYDIQTEKNHNFFANQVLVHNCLIFDEVDLTPQEILDEARYIADPTRDDHKFDPVYIYLSSRKTNSGPIQNMIDLTEREPDQYRLHKWSASDFMEKCPESVHKPELGKKEVFVHTETLQRIWGREEFEQSIPVVGRTAWKEISAFEGCKTCPAFIPCLGYSSKQRGDSPSLRKRSFVAGLLKPIKDTSSIVAQSLNWKPEAGAIVFRDFARHKHLQVPVDFYEWVSGKKFNPDNIFEDELELILENGTDSQIKKYTPTKKDIYEAMIDSGWTIINGIDWGYTDPAVSVVVGWHKRWKKACILHQERATGYSNHVWAEYVSKNINPAFPCEIVCPDMQDAACHSYFSKYKIPVYSEAKKRIEVGVSFVRGLLWNPVNQTINFAILDDSEERGELGNLVLVEEMEKWSHHKKPTGEFDMSRFADDHWTHGPDALRYALAPFIEESQITISVAQSAPDISLKHSIMSGDKEAIQRAAEKSKFENQLADHFRQEHGLGDVFVKPESYSRTVDDKKPKKSGSIKFKF